MGHPMDIEIDERLRQSAKSAPWAVVVERERCALEARKMVQAFESYASSPPGAARDTAERDFYEAANRIQRLGER